MPKAEVFTVIGAGSWGTALAVHLAKRQKVWLWTREPDQRELLAKKRCNEKYLPGIAFPENLNIADDLQSALNQSSQVLLAVPSHGFKTTFELIAPMLKQQGIIWATKGLDPETGHFLDQIAQQHVKPSTALAVLTGPSFAKEVALELPTAVVIAANEPAFAKLMQTCFQTPYFKTYLSSDMLGAELGGAVKNILAIAVGIAEGLGFGTNTKSVLMTRGLAEIIRLGLVLGAKKDTMIGLSGLGDLILTCSDKQSRNLRFGIAIGQGKTAEEACKEIGQVVEGIQTTATIYQLAKINHVEMPIVEQMYQVLYNHLPSTKAVQALMSRQTSEE
jgi:glycerol-3-phosphate dehydrogenase (NAD(P)+)